MVEPMVRLGFERRFWVSETPPAARILGNTRNAFARASWRPSAFMSAAGPSAARSCGFARCFGSRPRRTGEQLEKALEKLDFQRAASFAAAFLARTRREGPREALQQVLR